MRTMYIILAAVGWAWFAIAGSYLWFRLRPRIAPPGLSIDTIETSSTEAVRDE